MSLVVRKPVFRVLKPGCTATEYGLRREISGLGSIGIVLSVKRKQRRCSASLFSHMQKAGFLITRLKLVC